MPDYVWIENVVFPLVGMGMATLAMFGVYRLAVRWIDRRHERALTAARGEAGDPELTHLRSRVDALEGVAERVQELEERLDFAERLLTQPARDRLPGG